MSLNTTPRTWVAGEVVTAAEMNAEIRDAIAGLQAAWSSYTPTLTNITLGNGTVKAFWSQVGKTIHVRVRFAASSTTSYSAGALGISAPITPHADYTTNASQDHAVGSAALQPAGVRFGSTVVFAQTASGIFNFMVDNLTSNVIATNLIPATWNTGAVLSFTATYQAA